jgi:prevent-host-death family protein
MLTTLSCSQARRRFRRLLAMVAQGHTVIITKHGKPMAQLVGILPN